MHHIFHRGTAVIVVLLRILTACAFARAESCAADTMRLAGFEGDAQIEDASGQPRFAKKNARFGSVPRLDDQTMSCLQ